MRRLTLPQAVERARVLVESAPGRVILGITGKPGAGKSTLTTHLVAGVPESVAVGMDAFHLAHSTLAAQGEVERKGAVHTFDGEGYVALLRRIRHGEPGPIWAPEFRRDIEDAVAGAVAVRPEHRLVVTEGNYLLLPERPWSAVRELCDEIWYVDVPESRRLDWLIARHMLFGRDEAEARERATTGSDAVNAELIGTTALLADAWVSGK